LDVTNTPRTNLLFNHFVTEVRDVNSHCLERGKKVNKGKMG